MDDADRVDLSGYTLQELEELAREIRQEIASKRVRYRRPVALVERAGPVYRNPANACETWSGRGQPPAWFDRAVARGRPPLTLLG